MLLALFLPIYTLLAQTGPGGVGNSTTNGLWLKADDLSLSNGDDVSTWNDVSGNNNDANQTIATEKPSFISSSSFNNYPSIDFNGVEDWLRVEDADILDGTSEITYFTIFRPKGLYGSNDVHGIVGKRTNYSTSSQYAYDFFFYDNKLTTDIVTQNNRYNANSTSFSNDENYILSFDFDGDNTSGARSSMYKNGGLIKTGGETSTSIINSSEPLTIGTMNVGYNKYAKGEMSELIHFNYKLNAAESIIVNNYLSAKYDIALTENDLYTQDDNANGDFDHNVAGIGQASDGTNHTDSQGSGIVRINNPSNLTGETFLFWGEETKAVSYALVSDPITYSDQLNTKWRVSKTGSINTVSVTFDISEFSTSVYCDKLKLVVDNDSDFTSPTSYELVVSGTTATATGVVFSDNDYFTVRTPGQIVWDGTTFFNGSGALNAPNDTDECLKLTVKSGDVAVVTADVHVREIEVEAGGVLQVADGILLEVENGVVNNGTINLLNEAQLIQNHSGTSLNSGSGNLTGVQQGSSNLYNYNYWSSPVQRNGNWKINYLETAAGSVSFTSSNNASTSGGLTVLSSRWLYTFNGLTNAYADWNYITPATNIAPGLGYTMKGSGNTVDAEQEYVFKGTANDGDIVISVSAGDEILIGNPYTSALDADQFINDNLGVIDGTIYYYEQFQTNGTHNLVEYQGGYGVYNLLGGVGSPAPPVNGGVSSKGGPEKNIPVGQGFFVRAHTSGNITFTNSQRVFVKESSGESTFFRTAQESVTDTRIKFWLKFKDANENESTIALGYDTNASDDFDYGYDSRTYNDLSNEIYWTIADEELSIQGLHSFEVSDDIPLGLRITNSGDYTFEISETLNFPESETIYLKDAQTNSYYNITDNPVTLNLTEGIDDSRFSIVYQTEESLSIGDINTNDVSVFYNMNKETLVLNGIENLNAIKSVTIHNILGQNMATFNTVESNEISLSVLKTGIYIAEITQDNGVTTKLKFVKR